MKLLMKSLLVAGAVAVVAVEALGADAKANLQVTMLTKVNPQALSLWDLTNAAQDDKGDIDPKKIDAATWAKILEIGKSLEEGGRTLATSNGVIAAAPGARLQDQDGPGASKAADVQRYIDAKPAEFRKQAAALQSTGAAIVAAATKRDGRKLNDLSNSLDQVCEDCHQAFWYPQQSAPR